MKANDRLDALLTTRQAGGRPPAALAETSDDTLLAQLVVADLLAQGRAATPSAQFNRDLEVRLLVHAARLEERAARRTTSSASSRAASAGGTIGARQAHGDGLQRPRLFQRETRPTLWARGRLLGASRRLSTALLVLSFLLALSIGIFAAAAKAAPGSALFGLHRLEQNVRVSLAGSPSERARLHLSYTRSDLAALNASLANGTGGSLYRDALAAFQSDLHATATDLRAVAPGGDEDALATQLSALQAQARSDLLASLRSLPWSDRVATTVVLGDLGVSVPVVTSATITRTVGRGTSDVQMVVVGSDFQAGAVAEVEGAEVGVVIAQSPTNLVLRLDGRYAAASIREIGVSNPDGTAATTPNVLQVIDSGGEGQPTPAASPTPDGGNGTGNGHPGGGPHGTPTPSH
jgi:hypothetical protein